MTKRELRKNIYPYNVWRASGRLGIDLIVINIASSYCMSVIIYTCFTESNRSYARPPRVGTRFGFIFRLLPYTPLSLFSPHLYIFCPYHLFHFSSLVFCQYMLIIWKNFDNFTRIHLTEEKYYLFRVLRGRKKSTGP